MSRIGDGFFSVLVITLFASLLLTAGGAGVAMAVALMACGAYRVRCSLVRLSQHDGAASVLHA